MKIQIRTPEREELIKLIDDAIKENKGDYDILIRIKNKLGYINAGKYYTKK